MQTAGDVLEDRLRHVLAFVDGHVKFAETKNAALFAVTAAISTGAFQVLISSQILRAPLLIYVGLAFAASTVAGIASLASFLPQTKIPWIRMEQRAELRDNLLFFGDIQKYAAKQYLAAVRTACGAANGESAIHAMLAEQIVVNARIASRKFTFFRYGIWAMLCAVLTPIGALVIILWLDEKHGV